MSEILLTPQAHEDLLDIWVYIAKNSPHAADRALNHIDQRLKLLARSPRIGRNRAELASGLRSHPAGSYVVFYRIGEKILEVIRILHGSRDIPSFFEVD